MQEKRLQNVSPHHAMLTFAFTVSLLVSLSCSTQMHYYRAKTFYAEENYEAALCSVNAALQAKPHNEDFLLLRSNITIELYRSYGLPVIALHHLSQDETHRIAYMDSIHKRKVLINEIEGKFTVPIVIRFSDSISEAERQLVRSTIAQELRESSADGFCRLSLLEHPDSSASVVLDIDLEDFAVKETKGEPNPVWSKYKSGLRLEPNPDYLRLVAENRRLVQWQQYLTDLQTDPSKRPHWDAEHFLIVERMHKLNRKAKHMSRELASTPSHVSRPAFTAYQFIERDYVLEIEMVFKYRLVDFSHRLVLKEETVHYADTRTLKEIQNVHPEDPGDRQDQEIEEKDIVESLSMMKQQLYSNLAEEAKNAAARILYYRAKDYQTLGSYADAWEHYYVFLKTLDGGDGDEEYDEARSIVNEDPLKFPLVRGNKIPSDRKPPTMETSEVACKQEGVPHSATAPAEKRAHTRRLPGDFE